MNEVVLRQSINAMINSVEYHFEIMPEEKAKFSEYRIIRHLEDEEYVNHSRIFPGYGYDRNLVYVPEKRNRINEIEILEIAAAYLFAQLNPSIVDLAKFQVGQEDKATMMFRTMTDLVV